MKEGDNSFEVGENEVFINETLAKRMNMDTPVGKYIELVRSKKRIKGVVCDFQIQDPNTPVVPMLFTPPLKDTRFAPRYIAFKYEGDWNTCKKRLEEELKKKEIFYYKLADGEEFYHQYIKSEHNLLKLLGIITAVSILIAIRNLCPDYAIVRPAPQGNSHPQGLWGRCNGYSDDVLQRIHDASGNGCGHSLPHRICPDEELGGAVYPTDRNYFLDLSWYLLGHLLIGYALHRMACVEGCQ
jgi:hypothetical protein